MTKPSQKQPDRPTVLHALAGHGKGAPPTCRCFRSV